MNETRALERLGCMSQMESEEAGSSGFLGDIFEGKRMLLEMSSGKVKSVNRLYLAVRVVLFGRTLITHDRF